MAAFTGYDPIDSERSNSKYGTFDPTNLQRLDPRNAPAAPAAASRGALPAGPVPAVSTAFPETDVKGVGEARRPQQQEKNQFFDMWLSGSEEDRDRVASQQERVFSAQGMSLEGATKLLFNQGGEVAARLGAKYGLVPPADKAGMPAFKTQEQALADYRGTMDERKQEKLHREKRAAMGGFLMEMGLRILASNRGDAGGAIAEGALGTMGARDQRKKEAEAAEIAKADRERKQRREDESDTLARERAEREERQLALKEKDADKPKLAQITDKDGNVLYVEEKAGYVTDENGERVRKATDAELSEAQQETSRRARESQLQSERRAVQKLVDEGYSDDPDIIKIIDETDPDKRRSMVAALARKRVESLSKGAVDNDPLGLGL